MQHLKTQNCRMTLSQSNLRDRPFLNQGIKGCCPPWAMAGERELTTEGHQKEEEKQPDAVVSEAFQNLHDQWEKDGEDGPEEEPSKVKLTAGLTPRCRPISAIEREQELIETFAEAAKRSTWNPDWEPEGVFWNPRHQLAYNNDEMSQNCRCYFDRWLDHRELLPPDAQLQAQKPTWRLEPDALPVEQREAERIASTIYSPTGPGLRGSGSSKSASYLEDTSSENINKRRSMRLSRDKPWMTQPARFWQLPQPLDVAESMVSTMTQTDFPQIKLPNEAREQDWDRHHHATWSNFQNLQGKILNPAPVRSYFDRPREPDIGARSAEKRLHNVKDGSVPDW